VYILDQLDGTEAGDTSSTASSDVLMMLPARELLRNALMRNTGLEVEANDERSDAESSDSNNDALMMLPARELEERLRRSRSNDSQ